MWMALTDLFVVPITLSSLDGFLETPLNNRFRLRLRLQNSIVRGADIKRQPTRADRRE
jgi:hypothetical protein